MMRLDGEWRPLGVSDDRPKLARGARMLGPNPRRFEVRVAGAPAVRTIEFTGRPMEIVL